MFNYINTTGPASDLFGFVDMAIILCIVVNLAKWLISRQEKTLDSRDECSKVIASIRNTIKEDVICGNYTDAERDLIEDRIQRAIDAGLIKTSKDAEREYKYAQQAIQRREKMENRRERKRYQKRASRHSY